MDSIYSPIKVKLTTVKPTHNPNEGTVLMYPKSDGWYFKDSNGFEDSMSPSTTIPSDFTFNDFSGLTSGTTILIQDSFDLNGATLTLPYKSSLKFTKNGKLTNGTIITNNTYIDCNEYSVGVLYNTIITGNTLTNRVIHPEWFTPVNTTNWYSGLQAAIDLSALYGSQVSLGARVYQYQGNLKVPAGVTVKGVGRGETAFSSGPTLGSVLFCTSGGTNNRAFEVVGKFVTLSDFTIKGESRFASINDGLVINGVGDGVSTTALIESLNFNNILIHSCKRGFYMVAGNSGAVTYSTFNNIRVRDCQNHLSVDVLSSNPIYGNRDDNGNLYINENAFINSNKFSGFYSSGFSLSGIKINTQKNTNQVNSQDVYLPANDLQFDGSVLESPYSQFGHIRLESSGCQVIMRNTRIEATTQDSHYPETPVIYLGVGVNNCLIDMNQQSVTMVDLGYNNIFRSNGSKSSFPSQNSDNLYKNSGLYGLKIESDGTYSIPEWVIQEQCVGGDNQYVWRTLQTGSSITMSYDTNVRQDGYKALKFHVPPKYQIRMYQNINSDEHLVTNAKVNAYVIANNLKDVQFTYQDSKTGIISSSASFGSSMFSGNTYEPIGGWFPVRGTNDVSYYRIALFCQNIQELTGSSINFSVTQPQFVKGIELKNTPAKNLTELGGTVYGILGRNIVENILPVTSASTYTEAVGAMLLPKEGSVFEFGETGFYVQKINYNTNRFPRGSEITLVFQYDDIQVLNSAFIKLNKDYYSEVGSTLTLFSRYGDGIWEELGRYSKKEYGYTTYEISNLTAGTVNYLTIPRTGDKYLNLTNNNNKTLAIQRINNLTNRFLPDTKLHLEFNNTNGLVQLYNSTYLNLAKTGNYTPLDGDWLELLTKGDGTWTEVSRKQLPAINSTLGSTTLDISTIIGSNIVTLPRTGENCFTIANSGGTAQTINRINDSTLVRFNGGTNIVLDFTTSAVTLTNSAYITLSKTGNYTPAIGEYISLYTKGNGTWTELFRSPSTLPYTTMGYKSVFIESYLSSGFLVLPQTGENYFTIDCSHSGGTIQRINYAAGVRFPGGKVLTLEFANLSYTPTLSNSGYLLLSGGTNFTPTEGKTITLITKGDGIWKEQYRA